MNFLVFGHAVKTKGTAKATLNLINILMVCAEMLVNLGNIVIAGADDVAVVPVAMTQ